MRNVLKALSSAGSLALVLSGTAMAGGAPGGFDNWSVNATGTVAATCPVGFTCADVVTGAGFLQQEVTSNTAGGPRYIRTVIGEGYSASNTTPASLTFASEDFVQMGGVQGLASKMNIKEGVLSPTGTAAATIDTGFGSGATILTGWGVNNAANSTEATLTLGLSDKGTTNTAAEGNEFLTNFSVTTNTLAASGANVTSALAVDQTVYVGGTANPTDRQRFVTMIGAAAAAQTAFKFATNTTDPATLTYAVGDKIQVVWAGQNINGAGAFSTESLIKVADGSAVRASVLTSPNTFEWTAAPATVLNSEFGATPVF